MKTKFSSKVAKRLGATSLALTMAFSTAAYATPDIIFLRGDDNKLHGFSTTALLSSTSGSALRVEYENYLVQAVKKGEVYLSDISENGTKLVPYRSSDVIAAGSFDAYVEDTPAVAEGVVTTYAAVTVGEDGQVQTIEKEYVPEVLPVVSSVAVTPVTSTIAPGASATFTAVVAGENSPSQAVIWSITGAAVALSADTKISELGVLAVGADETNTTLTVVATSVANAEKQGTATVTISAEAPTVTDVVVTPGTTTAALGAQVQFTVQVTGTNSPAETVTWSVSGAAVTSTITADGLLTIAADEVNTELTVVATSTVNTDEFGTAKVTVSSVPEVTPFAVNSVALTSADTITVKTADTSGTAITIADFAVTNTAGPVTFTFAKVSSTEFTLTLTSALAIGASVTVATKGHIAATSNLLSHYNGSITGGVVSAYADKTNTSAACVGVVVNLTNAKGDIIATTRTEADGTYKFLSVKAGTYNVQFVKEGYSTDIDTSMIVSVVVAADEKTVEPFTLKSSSTEIKAKITTVASVDFATGVIKIAPSTTASALISALNLAYGPDSPGTGIQILATSAEGAAAVAATSIVTSANAVKVTAADGITTKFYEIKIASTDEIGLLSTTFGVSPYVGKVRLVNVKPGMSFKVGSGATNAVITTYADVSAAVGDVITIWVETAPTVTSQLTVAAADITPPATFVFAASQEVAKDGTLNVDVNTSFADSKVYASKATTKATFATTTEKIELIYVPGESKLTIPSTVTAANDGTYYVYVVHTPTNIVSVPSTNKFTLDNTAPVLAWSGVGAARTGTTQGTLTFTSNETITGAVGSGFFAGFKAGLDKVTEITPASTATTTGNSITTSTAAMSVTGWDNVDKFHYGTIPAAVAATVTLVAVDKAGNRSNVLTKSVGAFESPLAEATYTIVTSNSSVTADNKVSAQNNGTISVNGAAVTETNPIFPLLTRLTNSLSSGDTFGIDANGKINALTVSKTSTAALSLEAAEVSATNITLTVADGNKLTLTGSTSGASVTIAEAVGAYDLSGLDIVANAGRTQGVLVMPATPRTVNVKVKPGTVVKTNTNNAAIINGIKYTGETLGLTVLATATENNYEITASTDTVAIDTQTGEQSGGVSSAAVTVKFVGDNIQQADTIELTGQKPTDAGTLTVSASNLVGASALVTVKGGKVVLGTNMVQTGNVVTLDNNTTSGTTITAGTYDVETKAGTIDSLEVKSAGKVTIKGVVTSLKLGTIATDVVVVGSGKTASLANDFTIAASTSMAAVSQGTLIVTTPTTLTVNGNLNVTGAGASVLTNNGTITINTTGKLQTTSPTTIYINGKVDNYGTISASAIAITSNAAVNLYAGSILSFGSVDFTNCVSTSTAGSLLIQIGSKISTSAGVFAVTKNTVISGAGASVSAGAIGTGVIVKAKASSDAAVATSAEPSSVITLINGKIYDVILVLNAANTEIARIDFVEKK